MIGVWVQNALKQCKYEKKKAHHRYPINKKKKKNLNTYFYQKQWKGTFLAVQCLGLCASSAGGEGLIPSQESKISHAVGHGQVSRKEKNKYLVLMHMYGI